MAKQQQYHLLSGYIASIYRQSKAEFKKQTPMPGLSGTQSDIVMFLYDHPGLCQGQIADMMAVNPSLMARDVKALLDAELIHRQDNPADRRAKVIGLTPKGVSLAKKQISELNAWWSAFFEDEPGVNPQELYQELVSVNHRLLEQNRPKL
ncbi:hypothetical protein KIM372_10450 [Bombiscardovia nodaiensis]|uniref:HTH marR-type domain-containing protein n=1 Tax=Bombiscardovia nodaiensis TaxID=2932181 RepID=A0ABM8B8B5_9BIFI|nr:hypothetical protein KIM372_10450 [Bombiscardovia nodaiensis]